MVVVVLILIYWALTNWGLALRGGNVKPNAQLALPIEIDGEKLSTSVVIDANW